MNTLNRIGRTVLLLVMISIAGMACAQNSPVRWRCFAKMTSATEGVVTVKALISEGWHLYGLTMPDDGPMATSISFDGSSDVKFTSELKPDRKPETKHDDMFGSEVNYWQKNVEFTRTFKVTGPAPKISGAVTFMGCNDETCLPPSRVSLSASVVPFKK